MSIIFSPFLSLRQDEDEEEEEEEELSEEAKEKQLQNFFDTRGDFKAGLVEVGQNPDTVGGGGSGAMVMLMIGGVVLWVALSGA